MRIRLSFIIGLVFLTTLALSACAGSSGRHNNYAPVMDLGAQYARQRGYYEVTRGESLYLIAWRLDIDYKVLARINHIKSPYQLTPGQRLKLSGGQANKSTPVSNTRRVQANASGASKSIKFWEWPAKGTILDKYSQNNKGINIGGIAGEPIRASAGGEVVYAGDGLSAYGNLLIIKHNGTYLSAYAHNQDLQVKEGQTVKQGQIIAHMGSTGTNKTMLHFEIRKNGKPVNPLQYLH